MSVSEEIASPLPTLDEMVSSLPNRSVYDIRKLKVTDVTIFGDRAEIKRALSSEMAEGGFENGLMEIVLTNLPQSIDGGSIRVEGSGIGTIADVKYEAKETELDGKDKETSRSQEERRKQLDRKRAMWKNLREMLDGAAKVLGGTGSSDPMVDTDELKAFYDFYTERQEQLAQLSIETSREIDELDRKSEEDMLKQPVLIFDFNISRQVSILVADVKEAGRVELVISYFVRNASWTPAYDIRVVDKKMTLIYYGMIKQHTDENWDDVQVILSTAKPSVGGKVPVIGRAKIGLKPKRGREAVGVYEDDAFPGLLLLSGKTSFPAVDLKLQSEKASPSPMKANTMKVIQESISTSFRVPRLTAIPSDGAEHRLVIGQIELNPTFKHRSVPCKEPSAYLTARVVNTSEYHLLAGPTSVYLGNSFVCKGRLESVGPRGEFVCSLGVDNNVKITYKPLMDQVEQAGKFFSSKSVLKRERKIEVKNLSKEPIRITVADRYPMSADDNVKVPEQSIEGSPPDSFSKDNGRVEWKLQLNPDEERVLSFKYKVEYPTGAEIELQCDDDEQGMMDGNDE